ncbi:MAG: 2-hydroxymuconate tautomerase [Pseudomonadota bacterium]
MPIVNVTMIEGRSDDQKEAMFREVTEAICRTLSAPPESVRIVVTEVPARHFAAAGESKAKAAAK